MAINRNRPKRLLARQKIPLDNTKLVILYITGYLKLPIEVVLRRNFGRQYFHIFIFISGGFLMLVKFKFIFIRYLGDLEKFRYEWLKLVQEDYLWYFFAFIFIGFGILRMREVYFLPNIPGKSSLDDGDVFPIFKNPERAAKFFEPLIFLIPGILMNTMEVKTNLGTLFVVSSLAFSLNNFLAYSMAEVITDDMKDQQVTGEAIAESVAPIEGKNYDEDGFVIDERDSTGEINEVK